MLYLEIQMTDWKNVLCLYFPHVEFDEFIYKGSFKKCDKYNTLEIIATLRIRVFQLNTKRFFIYIFNRLKCSTILE